MRLFSTFTLVPYSLYFVVVTSFGCVSHVENLPCTWAASPFLILWHLIRRVSLSCQRYLPSVCVEYFSVLSILRTVIQGRGFTPCNIFPPSFIALKCIMHSVPPARVQYLPRFLLKLFALPPAEFLKVLPPVPHLVFPCCAPAQIWTVSPIYEHTLFWFRNLAGRILRSENSTGSLGLLFPLAACNMPFYFLVPTCTWVYFILLFLFTFLMFSTFFFLTICSKHTPLFHSTTSAPC